MASFDIGGTETQIIRLARLLIERENADVRVWAFQLGSGTAAKLCDLYGINWKTIHFGGVKFSSVRRSARSIIDLIKLTLEIRREHIDILASYLLAPNMIGGLIWKFTGSKLYIWNQRDLGLANCNKWLLKISSLMTKLFISNSKVGAELLTNNYKVNRNKVYVIPNIIPIPSGVPDHYKWREKLGFSRESFLVIMVANLTKYKDHASVIDAWSIVNSELRNENLDFHLLFAGSFGSEYLSLTQKVKETGLKDSVHFLGYIQEPWDLMKNCDLGILISPSESSPNSILEYMAAGLPVIATNNPGTREIFERFGDSYLIFSKDIPALADKIKKLALDPQLRYELGQENKKFIIENYSSDVIYKKFHELVAEYLIKR